MYDINLIRDRVVPERRRYIMLSIIAASGLACAVTIMATVFFASANSSTVDAYAHEIDKLEDDLAALYPGTPTEEELSAMINNVKPDLKRIGEIIDGRSETTLIWEAIAEAVPDSVWLTAVRVTTPEKSTGAKARRSATPGGWISVEGLALVDGDGGGALIRRFAKGLEQSRVLGGIISGSRFVETGMREIGSTSALGFEITCPFE
jgi:Tfp pilus assembly protein PilN